MISRYGNISGNRLDSDVFSVVLPMKNSFYRRSEEKERDSNEKK